MSQQQITINEPNKPATYPQKVFLHRVGLGENKKFSQWTMTKGQAHEKIQAYKAEQGQTQPVLSNLALAKPNGMANVLAKATRAKKPVTVTQITTKQVASIIFQLAQSGVVIK